MNLTERQRKHLRRLAHDLKPTIMVGNAGISETLLAELDSTLNHHELIKIKVRAGDRTVRDQTIDELARITGAQIIRRVGNMAVMFRPRPKDSAIKLP